MQTTGRKRIITEISTDNLLSQKEFKESILLENMEKLLRFEQKRKTKDLRLNNLEREEEIQRMKREREIGEIKKREISKIEAKQKELEDVQNQIIQKKGELSKLNANKRAKSTSWLLSSNKSRVAPGNDENTPQSTEQPEDSSQDEQKETINQEICSLKERKMSLENDIKRIEMGMDQMIQATISEHVDFRKSNDKLDKINLTPQESIELEKLTNFFNQIYSDEDLKKKCHDFLYNCYLQSYNKAQNFVKNQDSKYNNISAHFEKLINQNISSQKLSATDVKHLLSGIREKINNINMSSFESQLSTNAASAKKGEYGFLTREGNIPKDIDLNEAFDYISKNDPDSSLKKIPAMNFAFFTNEQFQKLDTKWYPKIEKNQYEYISEDAWGGIGKNINNIDDVKKLGNIKYQKVFMYLNDGKQKILKQEYPRKFAYITNDPVEISKVMNNINNLLDALQEKESITKDDAAKILNNLQDFKNDQQILLLKNLFSKIDYATDLKVPIEDFKILQLILSSTAIPTTNKAEFVLKSLSKFNNATGQQKLLVENLMNKTENINIIYDTIFDVTDQNQYNDKDKILKLIFENSKNKISEVNSDNLLKLVCHGLFVYKPEFIKSITKEQLQQILTNAQILPPPRNNKEKDQHLSQFICGLKDKIQYLSNSFIGYIPLCQEIVETLLSIENPDECCKENMSEIVIAVMMKSAENNQDHEDNDVNRLYKHFFKSGRITLTKEQRKKLMTIKLNKENQKHFIEDILHSNVIGMIKASSGQGGGGTNNNYNTIELLDKLADDVEKLSSDYESDLNDLMGSPIPKYQDEISLNSENFKPFLKNLKTSEKNISNFILNAKNLNRFFDNEKTFKKEIKTMINNNIFSELKKEEIQKNLTKIRYAIGDIIRISNYINERIKNMSDYHMQIDNLIDKLRETKIRFNNRRFDKAEYESYDRKLKEKHKSLQQSFNSENESYYNNISKLQINQEYSTKNESKSDILLKALEEIRGILHYTLKKEKEKGVSTISGTSSGVRSKDAMTSVFAKVWNEYEKEKRRDDVLPDEPQNNFYKRFRANNLDPSVALQITFDDKIIFVVAIFIFRQIALSITQALIERSYISTMYHALLVYMVSYIIIMAIVVIIVNIDDYKMRIVLNYFNMHANSPQLYSHIMIHSLLLILLYTLANNLKHNVEEKKNKLSEFEKLNLVYKIEILTISVFAMVAISVMIYQL